MDEREAAAELRKRVDDERIATWYSMKHFLQLDETGLRQAGFASIADALTCIMTRSSAKVEKMILEFEKKYLST